MTEPVRNNPGISQLAQHVEGSRTLAITTKVAELKAAGRKIIDLGAGEPDFNTPAAICSAGIAAIESGKTKYTPNAGIPALREAIAAYLNTLGGDYGAANVLVCCGAKHAIYNALLATCDPGDEVLFASPYWTSYPEQVKLAGAKPVVLETTSRDGFKVSAEQIENALSPKTKVLLLNSPSNPTGAVYSKDELDKIVSVISDKNVYILSDEIYLELTYGGFETCSLAAFESIRAKLLLVNGLSKSHAMTGWRIGYLAAEPAVVKAAAKIQSHSTSNVSSITQYAALAAFDAGQEEVAGMRTAFSERRDYVCSRLERMQGVQLMQPAGAFYVFPDVSAFFGKSHEGATIGTASAFCSYILETANVAIVPGDAFGAPAHIRISYANSMENLTLGLDNLEAALGALA